MLNLCTNRRLIAFPATDMAFRSNGVVLALEWFAIDLISDGFPLFVSSCGIIALVSTQLSAVAVNFPLFACEQVRSHCNIMDVGAGHFKMVHKIGILIHVNRRLVTKVLRVIFLRLVRFRVTFRAHVYLQNGAASTDISSFKRGFYDISTILTPLSRR